MDRYTIKRYKNQYLFEFLKAFSMFGQLRAELEDKLVEGGKMIDSDTIKKKMFQFLNKKELNIYILWDNQEKKINGFIVGEIKKEDIPYFEEIKYLFIHYFYVVENNAGEGWGRKLYDALEKEIKGYKIIKEIRLSVSVKNIYATKVYNTFGYNKTYSTMKKEI